MLQVYKFSGSWENKSLLEKYKKYPIIISYCSQQNCFLAYGYGVKTAAAVHCLAG